MADLFCGKCGEFKRVLFGGGTDHECPPMWLVQWPDGGEEGDSGTTVRARTAELAAIAWAERDPDIVEAGDSEIVRVRPFDDPAAPWHGFVVSAEIEIVYSATETDR